jgi:hypothetical protein
MNAGDVKSGRPSSEESWLSTPSTDPNAALWASITPPPSPTLGTALRRRVATLAPDLLAQRLHLALPQYFSSRLVASRALLGAVAALGAGVGLAAYVVAGSFLGTPSGEAGAASARSGATVNAAVAVVAAAERHAEPVAQPDTGNTLALRAEQTAPSNEPTQALANTAAMAPEQLVQALHPSDTFDEQPRSAPSKVKKRAHAKKRVKSRAKPRASRSATLQADAAPPERAAAPQRAGAPQRAKPRRQAVFKFN